MTHHLFIFYGACRVDGGITTFAYPFYTNDPSEENVTEQKEVFRDGFNKGGKKTIQTLECVDVTLDDAVQVWKNVQMREFMDTLDSKELPFPEDSKKD